MHAPPYITDLPDGQAQVSWPLASGHAMVRRFPSRPEAQAFADLQREARAVYAGEYSG
jgi:hypothetical protein